MNNTIKQDTNSHNTCQKPRRQHSIPLYSTPLHSTEQHTLCSITYKNIYSTHIDIDTTTTYNTNNNNDNTPLITTLTLLIIITCPSNCNFFYFKITPSFPFPLTTPNSFKSSYIYFHTCHTLFSYKYIFYIMKIFFPPLFP